MAADGAPAPRFQELHSRTSELIAQLGQLHDGVAGELAASQEQLRQADARQQAMAQELTASREKLTQTDAQLKQAEARLTQTEAQLKQVEARLTQADGRIAQDEARQKELTAKLDGWQRASQQWAADRKTLLDNHAAQVKELNGRIAALNADNDSLQSFQLQWAAEREEHVKARKEAEGKHAAVEQQLHELSDDHDKLKELHSAVTEQARTLVSEWTARRQSVGADTQALRAQLEEVQKTLDLSRQREKQWQVQVYKLQDELRGLRESTSRLSLSDEQSHHLISQLNAIIGFAEVLLDEAGSRATGEERTEFLHDIKESGAHLADYVNKLASPRSGEPPEAGEPQGKSSTSAAEASARIVLLATTDAAVRERTQSVLAKPGYRVEFANSGEEALNLALQLQPLAVMIDTELPPDGAQALIDALVREPRTRDIPVVLAGADDQQLFSLTVDRFDVVTKPINRGQLLQLMVKYDLLADRRRTAKMPTTVLVIDDDARNTRLVKAMLKPYTVSVLQADGGAEGIKLAQRHKPDLIILDLMMPDVDGFQVVSVLRADPSTSRIPILIYTAKNVTAGDRQRLQDGVQTIIRKGELNKEQFLELIYKRGERRTRAADAEAAA